MADRNERGRFVVGNKASPGRPKRAVETDYLQRMTELLSPDKWEKIVNKAITDAIKGNGYARQWLSDYVIGKPVTTINLIASEQLLLNQLLERLQSFGMRPADMFEAMLLELQEADLIQHDNT